MDSELSLWQMADSCQSSQWLILQGSILEPSLFLLCINDLPEQLTSTCRLCRQHNLPQWCHWPSRPKGLTARPWQPGRLGKNAQQWTSPDAGWFSHHNTSSMATLWVQKQRKNTLESRSPLTSVVMPTSPMSAIKPTRPWASSSETSKLQMKDSETQHTKHSCNLCLSMPALSGIHSLPTTSRHWKKSRG